MPTKSLPPSSELAQPFFDGCKAGELRLQRCESCQRVQFYPRIACTECDGRALSWVPASGAGTVASFTVVERAISSAYEAPYVVALIDLEEGPRMMSQLVEFDAAALGVGAAVCLTMKAWSDEIALPVFRPALVAGEPKGDSL